MTLAGTQASDGERLPAQQTTRSGPVSRPPNRHVPSPGKLFSDNERDKAARRASGEAAAAKRQWAAERAQIFPTGAAAVAAGTVVSLWLLVIGALTVANFINAAGGPSDLRHSYMCETRDTRQWYYWPPKRGPNPGQPPHHRVCDVCRASLRTDNLDKEHHRASRCGLEYECPDGACGPHGC